MILRREAPRSSTGREHSLRPTVSGKFVNPRGVSVDYAYFASTRRPSESPVQGQDVHPTCRQSSEGGTVQDHEISNLDPTVLFVNGWSTVSSSEWSYQLPVLGQRYDLLCHNNLGMGESGMTDRRYLHSCARNVQDLCAHLGIVEINVVAHSMGGLIATLFFTRYRGSVKIKTLTYINCPDDDPVRTFPYKRWLGGNEERILHSMTWSVFDSFFEFCHKSDLAESVAYCLARKLGVNINPHSFNEIYHAFLGRRKENMVALLAMREYGHMIGESMAQVDVPTLVISGKRDIIISPAASLRIHKRIAGSKYVVLDKSLHVPMFEEPERFNSVLLEFLEKHNF